MGPRQRFVSRLQEIANDPELLYAIARRLVSGSRRPASIDPEDHLHDAVLLLLELIRDTPETFKYPHRDMTPEEWLYLSVRRVFHSKSFYFREFSWAGRRLPGCAGMRGEDDRRSEQQEHQPLLEVTPLDSFGATIEDLCSHVPLPAQPLLRILAQGATTHQAAAVLGKKRSWVQWRLTQIRQALSMLSSVKAPAKRLAKILMNPKK